MNKMAQGAHESDERFAALQNNAAAIRAICAAVEGTLGPKGLDTMLVGGEGSVLITNDGVTILEKMDVTHPAARLLVQVARSQQLQVGDGTTTATVLAGALVQEGVSRVMRGVPVAKVVQGLGEAVRLAAETLRGRARPVAGLDDPMLWRIAYIAAREQDDIADLVVRAARHSGIAQLADESFRLADAFTSLEKGGSEVWPGLLLAKRPLHAIKPHAIANAPVLVLLDALEPDKPADEALATESGFRMYAEAKRAFRLQLEQLAALGVALIVTDRGVDAEAEQFCADRGIMVLPRLARKELLRVCAFTAAQPVRRAALAKPPAELAAALGLAGHVAYDEPLGLVRLAEGRGSRAVTVVVGASTREVAFERLRIAMDAASAVQAAVRGGYLPGGGAAELAVSRELERYRETVKGMEGFGVEAAAEALKRPFAQIVLNAGFNPLEKVEEARAAQVAHQTDALGIDCDSGVVADLLAAGIVDPAPVKIHALQAAGEVAAAIMRIHAVIKMKQPFAEHDE